MINCETAEFSEYDLAKLGEFLQEADRQKQAQAIDDAVRLNKLLAISSVCALRDGQDRFFVAERLPRFGSVVIEPLEALLQEPADEEAKSLASLVLLGLGSRAGVPLLLEALTTEPAERYAALIARTLTANGISEVGEVILERLRHADLTEAALGRSFESNANKDTAASLLADLKTLAIVLPLDLRQRLGAPGLPVEIRALL